MVRATPTLTGTDVRIRGTRTITTFQRLERTKEGFILRMPQALLGIAALDSTVTKSPLSCKVERIRDILVLRFMCSPSDSVIVARDGQRDLVCSIRTTNTTSEKSEKKTDDVGAEGVNGTYEKDVTLSIAKRLRDFIREDFPSTKVVMTRDADVFIELYKRTQIANEAGGKLFVSIHCNSMPLKPHPAHGCETYILRPGRNDDAARVAALENASVKFEKSTSRYRGMTADQIIIATMAQRSFVRLSETFASTIQREVTAETPLTNRGVSQAGFYVLVGASMPNVLVETGFLSNVADAEYLASTKGQKSLARSLANAIKLYASAYQRSMSH